MDNGTQLRIQDIYILQETLGRGGHGVTKRAVHRVTGREFAVKILDKRSMHDEA